MRFAIGSDSALGPPEVAAEFGYGTFPDGFAFDEDGGIWVTSLVSNRLLRVTASGTVETLFEDVNEGFVRAGERAFTDGTMGAAHLGPIPGTTVQQLTSVGFGGRGGRTGFLGSLHADHVYRFASGRRGAPLVHGAYCTP